MYSIEVLKYVLNDEIQNYCIVHDFLILYDYK